MPLLAKEGSEITPLKGLQMNSFFDTPSCLKEADKKKKKKKRRKTKIIAKTFGRFAKTLYLCNRLRQVRALSSVGSERLPYKQRVGGSNPSAPTQESPIIPLRMIGLFRYIPCLARTAPFFHAVATCFDKQMREDSQQWPSSRVSLVRKIKNES